MAIDIFVDDAANCVSTPSCGKGANPPCCKIQTAICNAVSGDTIKVRPGFYNESIRMKAGVPVISTNGPSVTTIDGTGKKCASTNWCGVQTNDCSVVLINDYVVSPTRFEGFTVTGGKGVHITSGGQKEVGGGIYIAGSPIVTNNIITGNHITGPATRWAGGGIYVTGVITPPPQAVITNNTITGNSAKPPSGGAAYSYGLGGGIYAAWFARPLIQNNIISNNEAGNRSVPTMTFGNGGGIFITNRDLGPTIVTGNLISGNLARDQGAGIAIEAYCGFCTQSRAVVTNNEIRGNDVGISSTYGEGGGVSLYYSSVNVVNNTFHANTAAFGGGMLELPQQVTNVVVDSNNVYTSNVARLGAPVGNAVHSEAVTCHTIRNNDFWQNGTAQLGGSCSPSVIGTNGNVSVNPLYLNQGANDYHLDPSSLGIDSGNNLDAPTIDRDGYPRPLDGNFDGTVQADLGEYELATDCDGDGSKDYLDLDDDNDGDPDSLDCDDCNPNRYHGKPESCNGIDDNCDGTADEGFPDTDLDGQHDCVDLDDDNDTVPDTSDCAPLINSVWSNPGTVGPVVRDTQPGTVVSWTRPLQSNIANVYRGTLQAGGWSWNHSCYEAESPDEASPDAASPGTGKVFYYMLQAKNRCGSGNLGSTSAGATRPLGTPCATMNRNSDSDAIPDIDDNCPLIANTNQLDNDHDTIGDVCDADRDNDGVLNGSDCSPDNAGVYASPGIVPGVLVNGKTGTAIAWGAASGGSSALYDIATGMIASAKANQYGPGLCLSSDESGPNFVDLRSNPAPGTGYYYMIRAQNVCGVGSYGTASRDLHGTQGGSACP